ncbi:putative cytochrome P450 [Corynespora cassiicola Philippines]|uniref:Putative cytochrome P450 n=1 Tax=Corynespora cassiicola Philippines TaxID=1448308 RepID=A0A2T2NC90_CORCC|nr:putative cytochrome P450 [Corynespora cassiicola Philippines]
MLSVISAGGLIIGLALSKIVYNIFLHPLRSYPGPWYAKATIFWSQYHLYKGDFTYLVHDLHQKYGSVVRVSPDELVYIDPEAWKDIYGHRNGIPENVKHPSRNTDPDMAHPSIITAGREQHSKLRRLLSHAFSEKSMRDQEPVIRSYIDLLIDRLQEIASSNSLEGTDIVRWYNFTTFDIIGHLAFAESFGCLENSEYHPWIEFMFSMIKFSSMMAALIRINRRLADLAQNLIPKRTRKQRLDLYNMTDELVRRRRRNEPSYTDFMTHLLTAEKSGKLEMLDVFSQAAILIIAGSETTATLLSGGTYHLLTNPRVYERVTSEIRSKFSSYEDITISNINELKYLLAFFDEALRMYPPAANNLPRLTPPEGTMIAGRWVPGNTVVGIHQYASFHSTKNFADPEEFAPERFLEVGESRWKNDRRDALQPFSFGPRNCIGRNLAYAEMRLILATILWNFDLQLAPGQEKWLDQKIYLVWEKHPLMVKFTPVKR